MTTFRTREGTMVAERPFVHSTPLPGPTDPSPRLRVVGREEAAPPPDLQDFNSIFRRYSPYVATIGLRIFGKADEVDDLVQEVFMIAHRDLGRVRHPERVRGWLATIAVRKAMNRLRKGKLRRLLSLEEASSYDDLADVSASPEQRAEVKRVYQVLETLPASDRVVWVLRHVEGHTLDEVVEFSGLSKSTVQRRLRKVESGLKKRASHV